MRLRVPCVVALCLISEREKAYLPKILHAKLSATQEFFSGRANALATAKTTVPYEIAPAHTGLCDSFLTTTKPHDTFGEHDTVRMLVWGALLPC